VAELITEHLQWHSVLGANETALQTSPSGRKQSSPPSPS
jgi:hypothetical protein